MREILFKAKKLDDGEWEEGYFLKHETKCYICPVICDASYGDNGNRIRFGCWYIVDPETVCQYTGLKDMNGKKIFEGDIIKIPDDYNEFGHNAGEIYEIYFCCGGFRLKPKYSKARGYWLEDDRTVEVIGTIFDNPELLEVTE